MKKKIHIDIDKKYNFPSNLKIVEYKDCFIIIAVDTACWIVLESKEQLNFFNLLLKYTIKEAIDIFNGSNKDIQKVLIQIEARELYSDFTVPFDEKTCMIYLTNKCNLRYPHCFLSAGIEKENELTSSELRYVIDQLAKHNIKTITFSGGEIALHP